MAYHHLQARLYNTPHLISPDKLQVIARVLQDHIALKAGAADAAGMARTRARQARPAPRADGVVVVPIMGTLVQRTGGMDAESGLRSYESIRGDIDAAMSMPVGTVVLEIDSGGGEAQGAFELADYIYQLGRAEAAKGSRGKRIIAYANEAALSAAYLIAAAAPEVVMPETGVVGSIGVIALHLDTSEAEKQAGLRYTAVYAGERKNDLTPHEPLTESGAAFLQQRVDSLYALFVERVAQYRGISAERVRGTQAAVLSASDALKVGLVDRVLGWTDFLSGLTMRKNKRNGGNKMKKDELLSALYDLKADAGDQVFAEALEDLMPRAETQPEGHVDMAAAVEAAKQEGYAAAARNARAILQMCELAGMTSMAMGLLDDTLDVDAARDKLISARARRSNVSVDSSIGAGIPEGSPLLAKIRAMKGDK